jgi:hypothetical protein
MRSHAGRCNKGVDAHVSNRVERSFFLLTRMQRRLVLLFHDLGEYD